MGVTWQMHRDRMHRTLAERLALLMFLSALALMNLGSPRIVCAAAAYQDSNPASITINDNAAASPYPSSITFAGVVGNITKVTVILHNITHTNEPSDIDIMLQGPTGANAVIMSDVGDAVAVNNVTITLDDAAPTQLPFAAGLVNGTSYRPANYNALPADPDNFVAPAPAPSMNVALSTFNGTNPNGTWNLWVVDSVTSSGGSIGGGWTLIITTDAPTAATVVAFGGTRYGDRVQLNWRTSGEVDNLGFQVYRDAGQGRELITPGLVAGSALQIGNAILNTDLSYSWSDMLAPGTGVVQYWLEDLDVNGQRMSHGPIVPTVVSEPAPIVQPAALLSQIGRLPRTTAQATARPLALRQWREGADLAMQRALAAQPAVKITVDKAGLYRVYRDELVAAGLEPTVDPDSLRLYLHGREQPIQVHHSVPGQFGAGDFIEFHGIGQDTRYTDKHVYWLVAGGGGGARVPVRARPGEPGGATSFLATIEQQEKVVYFASLLNGEAENFFGPPVTKESFEQPITLAGVDANPPGMASLEVALQGVVDDAASNPDHLVQVWVNGVAVGQLVFDGRDQAVTRFQLAQSLLQEGQNTITLQAQGDTTDVSLLAYLRLSFWRTYTAADDYLVSQVETGSWRRRGLYTQTLSGFTTSDIRVFDITHPAWIEELLGQVGHGTGYSVSVAVDGPGPRTLLALTAAQIKSPVALTPNVPSQWHATGQGAGLILVTHGDFAEAAQTLQAQRQAEGLSVVLVDIEDVYDENSYGEEHPQALKSFLQHAWANWQPPPRFVLLLGNSTYDHRDYLGHGARDFVPTQWVDTAFLEIGSDESLGDFDADGRSELPIGRLPVRTAKAARTVVDKLVGYARQAGETANRGALLVSDRADVASFAAMNALVRRQLPSGMPVVEVRRQELDDITAQQRITEQINAGVIIVSYAGHGSPVSWRGNLMTATAAHDLTNGPRLPVVAAMTCLNGYVHDPVQESLAEALLLAEAGGAVAVWASAGMTYAAGQAALVEAWTQAIFTVGESGQSLTLGEAAVRAKGATSDPDVRSSWTFYGDPSMQLAR